MATVKEEAKKIIDGLPDETSWDDIMYEFYVRQKIELGLKNIEKGKTISIEEAEDILIEK